MTQACGSPKQHLPSLSDFSNPNSPDLHVTSTNSSSKPVSLTESLLLLPHQILDPKQPIVYLVIIAKP